MIWLQIPASLCRKNITYDITTIYLTTWEGKHPLAVVAMWISTEEINYYCQTVPVFDISELIRAPFVYEAFRKHNRLHVVTLVVSVQIPKFRISIINTSFKVWNTSFQSSSIYLFVFNQSSIILLNFKPNETDLKESWEFYFLSNWIGIIWMDIIHTAAFYALLGVLKERKERV